MRAESRVLGSVSEALLGHTREEILRYCFVYLARAGKSGEGLFVRAALHDFLRPSCKDWGTRLPIVNRLSAQLPSNFSSFARRVGREDMMARLDADSLEDWKALARSIATYLKLEASIFYNQDGPTGRKYALVSVGTLSCAMTYAALSHFMNDEN